MPGAADLIWTRAAGSATARSSVGLRIHLHCVHQTARSKISRGYDFDGSIGKPVKVDNLGSVVAGYAQPN